MSQRPKFLFVLSSQAILPSRGTPTGWYLPELVHPYNKLAPHFDIVVASPAGGEAPLDPYSIEVTKDDLECQAFLRENDNVWKRTEKLSSLLGRSAEFSGIFYVGGHGPMFDLATDFVSQSLIREFYESRKVVSAVCHGPAALVNVKLSDGTYLVSNQVVTGLSDAEEEFMQFTKDMPFLLESELRNRGAQYESADGLFGVKVVVSGKGGKLITGQNPPSAAVIGDTLLRVMM
ncbi:ThiJ/PfpI [Penicillium canescens]|uniref:D-lactate dehydratase n=1 Tax=Penicillium canescens TaxID=5083 RepID=A0AAD6I4W0_PENCN|nr:ThiJ/PfpI [Penicillium canescens]KAJ6011877.1 ThiJ/PfpI [Penicillium canescens]KAJ6030739.1 ThiJ/PfpI [Penicillium canescens]KAJ6059548.1 ThiJ/PfpI [Penicillium canescens]KAJ6064473.1 ThiJ/PfpI [Penicillium canescens]KAJ6077261.1 ThiJ/PfpI [Penicillium canescens]